MSCVEQFCRVLGFLVAKLGGLHSSPLRTQWSHLSGHVRFMGLHCKYIFQQSSVLQEEIVEIVHRKM
jgi:hypothetical protein